MNGPQALALTLRGRIRGRVLDDDDALERYARDEGPFSVRPALAIVAADEDDVAATVRACADVGMPLTPRSGGTSLAGQSIGTGVVLDLGFLPARIEVRDDGATVHASASATVDDVNAALAPHGRRLGPDLTSAARARVGGIVGTNACGAGSLWDGRVSGALLDADVVLASGERITLGPGSPGPARGMFREPKSESHDENAMGYSASDNPATVLCGSEGTLAVLLAARLRTHPLPEGSAVGVLEFPSVRAALEEVPSVLDHRPYAIELLDRRSLGSAWPGDPAAILVVEVHGPDAAGTLRGIRLPGATMEPVRSPDSGSVAWRLRRSVLTERDFGPVRPVALIEDAVVPVERLPDLFDGVEELARRHGVDVLWYGHAAPGRLHPRPLLDLAREAHRRAAAAIAGGHADLVAALGGSPSGEHGLGLARSWLVPRFVPPDTVDAWRGLKRAFDPVGILSPGRVLPDEERFPARLLAPDVTSAP